jgi:hypothetical protein
LAPNKRRPSETVSKPGGPTALPPPSIRKTWREQHHGGGRARGDDGDGDGDANDWEGEYGEAIRAGRKATTGSGPRQDPWSEETVLAPASLPGFLFLPRLRTCLHPLGSSRIPSALCNCDLGAAGEPTLLLRPIALGFARSSSDRPLPAAAAVQMGRSSAWKVRFRLAEIRA